MNHRTYRYFSGEPLYGFGFGLSYTKFQYTSGELSTTDLEAGKPLGVTFAVKNIGDRDGDEVAELYLVPEGGAGAASRTLVGFQKIFVARGGSKTVQMIVDPRQLSSVSAAGSRAIRAGEYQLFVGGSQPQVHGGIHLPFRITGSVAEPQ